MYRRKFYLLTPAGCAKSETLGANMAAKCGAVEETPADLSTRKRNGVTGGCQQITTISLRPQQ